MATVILVVLTLLALAWLIAFSGVDVTSDQYKAGAAEAFDEWIEQYGEFVGFFNGGTPVLIVKNLDLIKAIQIKDFANFHDRGVVSNFSKTHPLGKLSLNNASGERWKQMRSLLTPAFKISSMKKMVNLMDECSNEFLGVVKQSTLDGGAIEVRRLFQKLAIDVIVRSAFGIRTGVQKHDSGTEMDQLLNETQRSVQQFRTGWLNFFISCFPELSLIWRCILAVRAHFMKLPTDNIKDGMLPIINMRRSNPRVRRDDLLQLMLNAEADDGAPINVHELAAEYESDPASQDRSETRSCGQRRRFLTNVEIQSNAIIFLIAGFETASAVLTFTAYLLAKHQRVQDVLRAEIVSVMERDCHFTYDNVFGMRYLDQVILESMRIYTPFVGFITRTCQREYNYNGLKIPAGLSILIPAYQLHHDRDLWNEPSKFDPDRFSTENRGMIDPMAFQPFGNGPRNCVGIRFAQLEMKLTLAKLLAKYRIKLDERHIKEDHLKLGSTFIFSYPQDGVWLKFEEI